MQVLFNCIFMVKKQDMINLSALENVRAFSIFLVQILFLPLACVQLGNDMYELSRVDKEFL